MKNEDRLIFKKCVLPDDLPTACDLLAIQTGLSKMRIKDAMAKGAVWITSRRKGRERLRRATARVKAGDHLELYYDPDLLSTDPPQAQCIMDRISYSIWNKPAGLLTQGTDYGDHCSLLRQVDLAFSPRREVYPVHRLDREAEGLVLVAHNRKAAREFSKIFQCREVQKRYRAVVLGQLENTAGIVDVPLDGRQAMSKYSVLSYDPDANTSLLMVEIETGRLHQIRRHLEAIGHPVMGDPRYGKGNKDGKPMRLTACELEFLCPLSGAEIKCSIDGCLY
jgi:tRNA pseudouridine32 synthase / 23S rRNA pseudouridine746 synthase